VHIGAADRGEFELLTAAGRVAVTVTTDGDVRWEHVRDLVGPDAATASASGDDVAWPIRVGAVPAVCVRRRGQYAGEPILEPRKVVLPQEWTVLSIRDVAGSDPPELLVAGQLRRCHHDRGHEADGAECLCACVCCRVGVHLEEVSFPLPAYATLLVVTQSSSYELAADGSVLRIPDGDRSRASVVSDVAMPAEIALGEQVSMILGGRDGAAMRRTSPVRALVLDLP